MDSPRGILISLLPFVSFSKNSQASLPNDDSCEISKFSEHLFLRTTGDVCFCIVSFSEFS